jgi:hypothetical protein
MVDHVSSSQARVEDRGADYREKGGVEQVHIQTLREPTVLDPQRVAPVGSRPGDILVTRAAA